MGNIIEIRNLKKVYKRFSLCIDKIEIQEGTITGLIGKNGAGKTTLINCLMNIIDSTYDIYTFNQKELNYSDFEFRAEIGYVGDSFDAYQNIKLSDITNFYKSVYGDKWNNEKYNSYMELFDLDATKKVSEISKGMKIKYQFALVLSREVKFLLLDEPTSGLDPIIREEILSILQKESKKNKVTVLFSSHITEDIERIATDLIFIDNGRIILHGSLNSIKSRFRIIDKEITGLTFINNFVQQNDFFIIDTMNIDENMLDRYHDHLKNCDLSQILVYVNGENNVKSNC